MDTRKKFHWKVPIQTETGRTLERDVFAFWDPEAISTKEAVARAAAIEAGRELKVGCQPVGEPVLVR